MAATAPVAHWPCRIPIWSGGVVGVPQPDMSPHHACSVNSDAGTPDRGPSSPNGSIRTIAADGDPPTSTPSPSLTTMSASVASPTSGTSSLPASRNAASAPMPSSGASGVAADQWRSRDARSTFTTVAPWSRSSFPA